MAQSRVITHDQETRLSVKARLAAKIDQALTPVVETIKENEILLIPSNHDSLSEGELLFTLTTNPEFKHSQDSALRTLGILRGKLPFPKDVVIQSLTVKNVVPLPEFVIEAPMQRKSTKTAPGFEKTPDSSPARKAAEDLKKVEFKLSLAHKLEEAMTPKPEVVQRVVRPIVQTYDAPPEFVEKVERKTKARPVKVLAREVENFQQYRVPANYTELSEYELGNILTRDPQFEHTPESATFVLDVLFGRREPAEIPQKSAKRVELKGTLIIEDDATVLLLPSNYKDFSDVELHAILLNSEELGHDEESALRSMRILRGWEKPIKFVLKTSDFSAEVKTPEPKQIKRNVKERVEPTPPPWFVFNNTPEPEKAKRVKKNTEPTIVLFPSNYADFNSDTDLHKALIDTIELGHTEETALLAMQAFRGWTNPTEVVLKPTDIMAQVPETKEAGRWVYVKEE